MKPIPKWLMIPPAVALLSTQHETGLVPIESRRSMTEGNGSQELVRIAMAYLASIAIGVTFLVANLMGADGLTALWRSVIAVVIACVASQVLVPPVVNAVLSAMARDEAERQAALEPEDEE